MTNQIPPLLPPGDMPPIRTQVDLVPVRPQQRLLDQLLRACAQILRHDLPSGTTVAFLRSRPGSGPLGDEDVAWAAGLLDAAAAARVPCRPVHVANDERVAVVPLGDLPRRAVG